jgi:putative glutamine amidotransferase
MNQNLEKTKPRIAIPEPCSYDKEYSERSFSAYLKAIEAAGGQPAPISLDSAPEEIARSVSGCAAILLPGSKADIDPQKYGAQKHPATAPADPPRDAADELLLQDAYSQRKPILGICYGLQALNVWRTGTLVQHLETRVQHSGNRAEVAHRARILPRSALATILGEAPSNIGVNSSHHQAAGKLGDGLQIAAQCPDDGVIEAIEGTDAQHYVLAVQWHPEKNFDRDPASRKLFESLIQAATQWELAKIP